MLLLFLSDNVYPSIEMIQQIILGLFVIFLARYLKQFISFLSDIQYKRRLVDGMAGPESIFLLGCIHKAPVDSKGGWLPLLRILPFN